MSASVRTLADHTDDVPFFHTFPLWVIEALHVKGIKAATATEIKVMPKTADVTVTTPEGNHVVKVRRSDVFAPATA